MDLQNKSGFVSRIISGQPAVKGQIPWHAGLRITKDAISVEVQLGVTKWDQDMTEKITSKDTQMHENYNTWLHNDIGVIKLPRKVAVSDTVKPIRLPSRGEASSILNFVELTTISNNDCANFHGAIIISSSICTVGTLNIARARVTVVVHWCFIKMARLQLWLVSRVSCISQAVTVANHLDMLVLSNS
ncbi:Jonah 44E [Carabus blaptoides fortunei]